MVTRREFSNADVWSAVAGFVMPAGLPPAWNEPAPFSGGYPSRWMYTEDADLITGLPIAIEWDLDLTPKQIAELDKFIRRARRVHADDDEELLALADEGLANYQRSPRSKQDRDAAFDVLVSAVRELLGDA